MNMGVQIFIQYSAFSSFGYIPGSEIAGSDGNSLFNFLRSCNTAFHSSGTILHFLQFSIVLIVAILTDLKWW